MVGEQLSNHSKGLKSREEERRFWIKSSNRQIVKSTNQQINKSTLLCRLFEEGEYAAGECDASEVAPHPALSSRRGYGILQYMKILLYFTAILNINHNPAPSPQGEGWGEVILAGDL